eukprot:408504-Rhodomonas_salina.1
MSVALEGAGASLEQTVQGFSAGWPYALTFHAAAAAPAHPEPVLQVRVLGSAGLLAEANVSLGAALEARRVEFAPSEERVL